MVNKIKNTLKGGNVDMAFEKRKPDYSGGQTVQIWKSKDKNGKEYLKARIFGHVVNCFQVLEDEEKKE